MMRSSLAFLVSKVRITASVPLACTSSSANPFDLVLDVAEETSIDADYYRLFNTGFDPAGFAPWTPLRESEGSPQPVGLPEVGVPVSQLP